MITWSRSSSLAIRLSVNPTSSSGLHSKSIALCIRRPLASILKLKFLMLESIGLKWPFGTLLVKIGSKTSRPLTTKEPKASFLCTRFLTVDPFKTSKTGSGKLINFLIKMYPNSSLATSAICHKSKEKYLLRRPKNYVPSTIVVFSKQVPNKISTLKKPSCHLPSNWWKP